MSTMFESATSFNQDLSNWDVSNVEVLGDMFRSAESFNQDLSNWDVSNVNNMGAMFQDATSFNGDISTWDVSSVTSLSAFLFGATNFNQDISGWDVSSVYHFGAMFRNAVSFDQDLSNWNVSNATYMNYMFDNAASFNSDISAWDVSNVTDMSAMFEGASALTGENQCAIHISFSFNDAWPYDWSGFCAGTITSIIDIPEDQGGRVYVSFLKSFFDYPEVTNQSYTILRMDTIEDSSAWIVVASGDAFGDLSYTYEVATLRDSTANDDGMMEYKVVAAMNEGNFHSAPAMGYYVDNLAPDAPTNLLASIVDTSIVLNWNMSDAMDLQYYAVYRSTNPEQVVTEDNFLEYRTDTTFIDASAEWNTDYYYQITCNRLQW